MEIAQGAVDIPMAHQVLQSVDRQPVFKQVGGIGVSLMPNSA
jgi:hypothetical protein